MSRTVTIELSDEEQEFLERYTKSYKGSLSSIIKRLTIEKLEDEYDLKIAEDFEKRMKEGTLITHPIEDLMKETGIDPDEIKN